MADRQVTHTGKDEEGDITKLCNPDEWWSPVSKEDAISHIDNETHSYYVQTDDERVDIHIVDGPTGKYLRTDPDKTSTNNLDDLPDC